MSMRTWMRIFALCAMATGSMLTMTSCDDALTEEDIKGEIEKAMSDPDVQKAAAEIESAVDDAVSKMGDL